MASTSEQTVLLHGDLDLEILCARDLPNMDLFAERLRRCFGCFGVPFPRVGGSGEPAPPARAGAGHFHSKIITSDPYTNVCVAGATIARTRVIPNNQNPEWNQHFKIPLAHSASRVDFVVKDNDMFGAQVIGTATVSAALIASGRSFKNWLPIIGSPKPTSALLVSFTFIPVKDNPIYIRSIAGDPDQLGVRDTYYHVRKGGNVTLYQDAHVREGELPEIKLDGGKMFQHEKCWEDICHAILEAHHLIYIVGWSIYDKVKLVREPTTRRPLPEPGKLTLGELLKYKSEEGVRVCLLIWDDKTSHDKFFFKSGGMMQTHDEETKKFFKHSSVICVLSPRYASGRLSIVKQKVVGTLYTHHQKCLLVDTEASPSTRKITAFLGGLDLCGGRYDTPDHRLFQDLESVYLNDIHNPSLNTQTKGPREPWHDLHCKIEGPAAYDVLQNFEQRWQRATGLWHSREDALLKIDRISWILSPTHTYAYGDPKLWVSSEENSENWQVQVNGIQKELYYLISVIIVNHMHFHQIFRSIDSGSVKGFPKCVYEAASQNLVSRKNLVIDKSIHTAYVRAIRSAQHFIYIENQYFLGSSYGWPSYISSGADNLIPMELALKIASKIKAGERFAVYIVIPMWPEGVPTSNSVQEILFWQAQTIEMMYRIIVRELKSTNFKEARPQDYLNFYCLGKREPLNYMVHSTAETSNVEVLSEKYRRFMIYVHSKGMIVDDEYVILGSANINQRSLDGSRDTEIAMGAYQPHHTWEKRKTHPEGQVYGYRMSLWAEHLGIIDECFKDPCSLECVRFVNRIAEDNWVRYTAEDIIPLTGHLLKYPIDVDIDGKLVPRSVCETFPDVGGKILGEPTTALPDELTM
ncbi:phospholipase D delta-like isoform X2 [Canna indica]|uniref:Phospholipase D n=1 Tax=Canna indica TaxID=4628 RepID=A0AAQ3QIS2_9LILI|nr:phospholipase D delta-like isoform X2 [Canna indica]